MPHKFLNILEFSDKTFDYIVKKIDGEFVTFFKGMDVAEFFEYADTDQAIRKHVDEDEKFKCCNWSNLMPVTINYNSSKKQIDMNQINYIVNKLEK